MNVVSQRVSYISATPAASELSGRSPSLSLALALALSRARSRSSPLPARVREADVNTSVRREIECQLPTNPNSNLFLAHLTRFVQLSNL